MLLEDASSQNSAQTPCVVDVVDVRAAELGGGGEPFYEVFWALNPYARTPNRR